MIGVPKGPPDPEPTAGTCELCGGAVTHDSRRRHGAPFGLIFHNDSTSECGGSWHYEDHQPVWGAPITDDDMALLAEAEPPVMAEQEA